MLSTGTIIQCDECGKQEGISISLTEDEIAVYENAAQMGWMVNLNGKDYCPNCYTVHNGIIFTKDGLMFDETTQELIGEGKLIEKGE